jgi:hypothetical protein
MSSLARLAVALLVPLLASCGGVASSSTTPATGGNGSTGGSGSTAGSGSTGGSGSTAGNGSTGGSGSTAGNGSGGSATCADYKDEGGPSVRVSIVNKTNAPIYLGAEQMTCGFVPLFTVADADGAGLAGSAGCRFSCSAFQTQGNILGCTDICLYPTAVALQPGEVKSTEWAALYVVPRDMPNACVAYDSGSETVSCDQAKRIQPGTYTFSARAGSTLDCSQTGAASCSACMSDKDGGCSTPGGVVGGSILTASSTVALDERYGVFTTSSAGSSPGAADAAPVQMLTVELVFTD